MTNRSPVPTQLKHVLDAIHLGILEAGEWRRAARGQGEAPDWIPYPQVDALYNGLEMEQWHQVPTEPERVAMEWRDAVLFNQTDLVEPLVGEVLKRLGFSQPPDSVAWRRFLRVALVVAADAHSIDADREQGEYRAGYPLGCSVSGETLSFLAPGGSVVTPPGREPARIALPPSHASGAVDARRHSDVASSAVEDVGGGRIRVSDAGSLASLPGGHTLEPTAPNHERLSGARDATGGQTLVSLAPARAGRRKPGQRSSRDVVIQEASRLAAALKRGEAGVDYASVTHLCKQLESWLRSTHPNAPQMKFESIAKALREDAPDVLALLCPIDPAHDGALGHARASLPTRTD